MLWDYLENIVLCHKPKAAVYMTSKQTTKPIKNPAQSFRKKTKGYLKLEVNVKWDIQNSHKAFPHKTFGDYTKENRNLGDPTSSNETIVSWAF